MQPKESSFLLPPAPACSFLSMSQPVRSEQHERKGMLGWLWSAKTS